MWKYIVITVVVLLVAALCFVADYALEDPYIRTTKKQIKNHTVTEEVLRLTLDILNHKVQIAKIQAQYAPRDPNDS